MRGKKYQNRSEFWGRKFHETDGIHVKVRALGKKLATFWSEAIAYGVRDRGEARSLQFFPLSLSPPLWFSFFTRKRFVLGREDNGQETQGLLCVCVCLLCVQLSVRVTFGHKQRSLLVFRNSRKIRLRDCKYFVFLWLSQENTKNVWFGVSEKFQVRKYS